MCRRVMPAQLKGRPKPGLTAALPLTLLLLLAAPARGPLGLLLLPPPPVPGTLLPLPGRVGRLTGLLVDATEGSDELTRMDKAVSAMATGSSRFTLAPICCWGGLFGAAGPPDPFGFAAAAAGSADVGRTAAPLGCAGSCMLSAGACCC